MNKKYFIVSLLVIWCLGPVQNIQAQIFSADEVGIISEKVGSEIIPSFFFINVSEIPSKIDSSFGIEKVCFHIKHRRPSDLKIELLSPTGTNVWISNRNGSNNSYGYLNTCVVQNGFDGPVHNPNHLFQGEYTAEGRMDFFNDGQNPNGTWLLVVTDLKEGVLGKVENVSITFGSNPARLSTSPCTKTNALDCISTHPFGKLLPDLVISRSLTVENVQYYSGSHPENPNQLRFAAAMANIGEGPLEVITTENWYCGDAIVDKDSICTDGSNPTNNVQQIIYGRTPDGAMYYDTLKSGVMYMDNSPGHNHYHVQNWANFRLLKKRWWIRNPKKWKLIANSDKVSYCLFDNMICDTKNQYCKIDKGVYSKVNLSNYGLGNYSSCNSRRQGISVGGIDYYGMNYEGQFIEVPDDIEPGKYFLLIEVDPLDEYLEIDETNNELLVPIRIGE